MFSSELDRVGHPFRTRTWGILLGSIILAAVAAALVSAKTVPFVFAVTLASFLIAAAVRGQLAHALPRRGSVSLHLAIFLLYALASSAWAIDPQNSILNTLAAILVGGGTLALLRLFADETRPNLLHMGEGLWLGFIVGLLYLFTEILTDQSIKIWLYNMIHIAPDDLKPHSYFGWSGGKLVTISREDLTRNMAPLTIFLWPAIAGIEGTLRRPWTIVVAVLTVIVAGAVVMQAWHETSKLALIVGLATFACAHVTTRLTGRLVATGWVVACLAVLPAALIAYRLDLHNASWLQSSARHRIIIWNLTAEQALKSPWLGVGARTTYVLGPRLERDLAKQPGADLRWSLSAHSHSVYLQTWFELGLIGAVLLTLLGLAILQAIRSLAAQLQPYAYATFASAAVMAGSSYGMWQIWFVSTFGFCAVLFGLSARLIPEAQQIRGSAQNVSA
jgi:O-Antigen ligase